MELMEDLEFRCFKASEKVLKHKQSMFKLAIQAVKDACSFVDVLNPIYCSPWNISSTVNDLSLFWSIAIKTSCALSPLFFINSSNLWKKRGGGSGCCWPELLLLLSLAVLLLLMSVLLICRLWGGGTYFLLLLLLFPAGFSRGDSYTPTSLNLMPREYF